MVGHAVGTSVELVCRAWCAAREYNPTKYVPVCLFVHEVIVEPLVDGIAYPLISGLIGQIYNAVEYDANVARNFSWEAFSEQLKQMVHIPEKASVVEFVIKGVGGVVVGKVAEALMPPCGLIIHSYSRDYHIDNINPLIEGLAGFAGSYLAGAAWNFALGDHAENSTEF